MSYVQVQKGGKGNGKQCKYVHFAWNEWDAVRRRSVQRRFYVGRIAADGDVIVNKRFSGGGDVRVTMKELQERAKERAAFEVWLQGVGGGIAGPGGVARVDIAGDAWLIRHFAVASGLATVLTEVFGEVDGGALCGLAAHQFATGHALYRAECWLTQRELPESWRGPLVGESFVHGFVARMGADTARREAFLERWTERHKSGDAVLYDTTSVSSHSPSLDLAEWGYNRDDEMLPQVNFSLATATDGTPLFYRVVPGSIPDVRTLVATLRIARGRNAVDEVAENVLRDYRARDTAEKLLDAFKTEHGQYRLRTASDDSVQGRFLLGFITLVLRAELEKRMRDAGLHKTMTDAMVLDELGKAKALVTRKGTRILLEVSKRQRTLLAALKVPELA